MKTLWTKHLKNKIKITKTDYPCQNWWPWKELRRGRNLRKQRLPKEQVHPSQMWRIGRPDFWLREIYWENKRSKSDKKNCRHSNKKQKPKKIYFRNLKKWTMILKLDPEKFQKLTTKKPREDWLLWGRHDKTQKMIQKLKMNKIIKKDLQKWNKKIRRKRMISTWMMGTTG